MGGKLRPVHMKDMSFAAMSYYETYYFYHAATGVNYKGFGSVVIETKRVWWTMSV